jgi:hypothetical protein
MPEAHFVLDIALGQLVLHKIVELVMEGLKRDFGHLVELAFVGKPAAEKDLAACSTT